jgi:hypothetical protein
MGAVFRLALKRGQCAKNPVDGEQPQGHAAREESDRALEWIRNSQ